MNFAAIMLCKDALIEIKDMIPGYETVSEELNCPKS